MSGILQMMTQWCRWQFRRRCPMDVSDRTDRRLRRRPAVEKPRYAFRQRQRVIGGQFGKDVVGMLVIDQRLVVVSLTRLEDFREATMGRGQRLCRKHLPEQQHALAYLVLLH